MWAAVLSVGGMGAASNDAGEVAGEVRVVASASAEAPSRDGTFTIEWAGGEEFEVELDAPGEPAVFQPWYRGRALQSFVSGLPDGVARVRVRARRGMGWTEWVVAPPVVIEHHGMAKALGLMGLGLVVFLTIAGYIATRAREVEA